MVFVFDVNIIQGVEANTNDRYMFKHYASRCISLLSIYSQTRIKRSSVGQRKDGLIRQVTSKKRFNSYKFSMTGQEKGDPLIQVTA